MNHTLIQKRNLMALFFCAVAILTLRDVSAQRFKTLYEFPNQPDQSYSENLLVSGNRVYGTSSGSASIFGSIFSINTDGSGFSILYTFAGGADGKWPTLSILSGSTIIGTASGGGTTNSSNVPDGNGTIFSINTDGSGFNGIYSFIGGSEGNTPENGVAFDGTSLYGTASDNIYSVTTLGSSYNLIYSFSGTIDGSELTTGVILVNDILYGAAGSGGPNGHGTLYGIYTDGSGFAVLHAFAGGADGIEPNQITFSGDTIYGTTFYGGANHLGILYAYSTVSNQYYILHTFTGGADGGYPAGNVVVYGNTIYGTASYDGGSSRSGIVFSVNTDGTHFTVLHTFTGGADGSVPIGLTAAGSTIYGTTQSGAKGNGTLFKLDIPFSPQFITFVQPSAITYSPNATFPLDATSSSGLPVSYTSSNTNVAVVSSNVVTVVGAGNTTITASQAGDPTYAPANSVGRVLKVSQASQTVSFSKPASLTYGTVPSLNLSAKSSSGLPISFTGSNQNVAKISKNTVTIVGAGNITITASQKGNTNYKPALSIHQVLAVAKATQPLMFMTPATESFVQGNTFTLSAIAMSSSKLPVTYKSSNPKIISIHGTTATIHAVGNVTLTASQAGNANYLPAVSPASVTVQ